MNNTLKNSKFVKLSKLKQLQAFTPVLVVGLLVATGGVIYQFGTKAATPGFTLTAAATSYKVGDTFDVSVYEDSGTDCSNVVDVALTYPGNLLRYNGTSQTGSSFDQVAASNTPTSSRSEFTQFTIRKECGTAKTSGISGYQFVSKVSFTVLAAGSAAVNFDASGTRAVSAADNRTNVAAGTSGKSFTLSAVTVTPTPTPSPNPNPTPTPTPTPTPRPTPTPTSTPTPVKNSGSGSTSSGSKAVTQVTPDGTDSSIPLTDNDVVEITTPVTVNPVPIQPNGVNKIEYYLNGDLVSTVKTSPYTYKLNKDELLNGKYTLTTKTYYSNGTSKSTSQAVTVNNPFSLKQVGLWVKKYAWVVILVLMILVAAIVAWIIHRRGHNNSGGGYYGETDYTSNQNYVVSGANGQSLPPAAPAASAEVADPNAAWQPMPAPGSEQRPTSNIVRPNDNP